MGIDYRLKINREKVLEILLMESKYTSFLPITKIESFAQLSREETRETLESLIQEGMVSVSRKFEMKSTAEEDSVFALTSTGRRHVNSLIKQKLAKKRYEEQQDFEEHQEKKAKKKLRNWTIGVAAVLVITIILLIVFL